DWDMVPVRTGRQPLTLDWLWAQHNEHRIPLPKLLYVALARGCGDLRAGMVFNVLCLAAVAAGLILAVRPRRGRTVLTDAVVPLVLLHLGQQQTLLWSFQVGSLTGTLLLGAVLALLIVGDEGANSPAALGVAACLLALPFCGANGLVFVPALAIWLLCA